MTRSPIGVIGLGLMGTAITERLLSHGVPVHVWNRMPEKARPLVERGAQWSDCPVAECDRVIISLFSSGVVAEVLGNFQSDLRAGQYLIDTTTGDPQETTELGERLAREGVHYLDAPISGSSEQTLRGEAVVMVGGDRQDFDECADLWPILARRAFYTGSLGSAARMKLVTNLVLGLNRAVLAEGLAFAECVGVSPSAALEILRDSPAYSRAMDVKGAKMIERDYSVQARLAQHLKDVKLMIEAAGSVGKSLPFSSRHCEVLEQAIAMGLGDKDNSAIYEALRGASPA
jgi:3-hydroxyisobutyrate dehydrogenase-like beta-hydroxyacid dehydrogenase